MTIVASLIASLTAIFIAVIVYPWQKHIDRANDLAREARALYWRVINILGSSDQLYETVLARGNEIDRLVISSVAIGDFDLAKGLEELKEALKPWHAGRDDLRAGGLKLFRMLLDKKSRTIAEADVERMSIVVGKLLQLANSRLTDSRIVTISLKSWIMEYLGDKK